MSHATGIDEISPEERDIHPDKGSSKQSGGDVEIKEQDEEEGKVEEEISEILNSNDFISKPFLSKKCTVPEDILVFQYPLLFSNTYSISDVNEHCTVFFYFWGS